MSLTTPYDPQNIFAKIIAGEIPCTKLYEDENILSFMDLFPQSKGHSLVISKKATAVNLFDIDTDDLSTLMIGVQKIGEALRQSLAPDGIKLAQFNGSIAGQTVFHLHFHLIPVYENTPEKSHALLDNEQKNAELEKIAMLIRGKL